MKHDGSKQFLSRPSVNDNISRPKKALAKSLLNCLIHDILVRTHFCGYSPIGIAI